MSYKVIVDSCGEFTPEMKADGGFEHVALGIQIEDTDVYKRQLEHMTLAMAYVPWQTWEDTYDVHKGLECGTIFPVLNKPFYGKGGCNQ